MGSYEIADEEIAGIGPDMTPADGEIDNMHDAETEGETDPTMMISPPIRRPSISVWRKSSMVNLRGYLMPGDMSPG
jgi:hypothetical protein